MVEPTPQVQRSEPRSAALQTGFNQSDIVVSANAPDFMPYALVGDNGVDLGEMPDTTRSVALELR